ncbi:S8 family serine peptidase [Candidatus Poriferisocius sp.]|uniref:S8 family serine peptidase n=1 Tax=Candidatus Poriferisocius sp. TaxID=3101276 RepID=UPI003B01556F
MPGVRWVRRCVLVVVFAFVVSACGGGDGGGDAVEPVSDGGETVGDAPVVLSSSGLDLGRLAEAVETLDPDAVCPDVVSPESFDGVVEVGRIEDGCASIEYVALEGRSVEEVREELSDDPSVFAVGAPAVDLVAEQAPVPPFDGDGYESGQWWHWQDMGADVLWDPEGWVYDNSRRRVQGWPSGQQVVVAVIDSGVDGAHRDLDDNVLTSGHSCHRRTQTRPDGSLQGRHGTHVAGLVAAEQNNGVDVAGLAPQAKILPVKVHFPMDFGNRVIKTNPADEDCYDMVKTLTHAIDLARTGGADVINLSLRWNKERDYAVVAEREGLFGAIGKFVVGADTVEWAIEVARLQGIVVVAAAGNCGDDRKVENLDTDGDGLLDPDSNGAPIWYLRADQSDTSGTWEFFWRVSGCRAHNQSQRPASYPEVIAVAATNRNGNRAVFSTANADVDVAAPGKQLWSTVPGGTAHDSGTSMASPIVSAAVAHMKARFPQATPKQIADALKSTASTHPRRTDSLGYGIIDPKAAIEHLDKNFNPEPPPQAEPELPSIIPNVGDPTPQSTTPAPTQPGEVTGLAYDPATLTATWNPADNANTYQVNLLIIDEDTEGGVVEVGITCCSFELDDSGITHVSVRAVNDTAEGPWSPRTPIPPPPTTTPVPQIGSPTYTTLTAGFEHSCAITSDGTIDCWGSNDWGQTDAPDGEFTSIATGHLHSCAINTGGTVECWGKSDLNQTQAPAGQFTAVTAGNDFSCGIRPDQTVACWGYDSQRHNENPDAPIDPPEEPDGRFAAISAGSEHACGIRLDGTIACWGSNRIGQHDGIPSGQFTAISAGYYHTCGIRSDSTIACWGGPNRFRQGDLDPPDDRFTAISAGFDYTCGIRTDKTVSCWGTNTGDGQADPPDGEFIAIAAYVSHTCGIMTNQVVVCWGRI